MATSRRSFIRSSFQFAFGAAAWGFPSAWAIGEPLRPIDVAYAGSMGSLMEGPVKTGVAKSLRLDFRGRAQGSNALAQLIIGGSIRPDVFISVTPGPMRSVLKAGKATVAEPIAHTEMVIAYSPRSRFASRFDQAAKSAQNETTYDVFQILQEPGLRFGRTDPATDPQGRNIIFTAILAEKVLQKPGLAAKILGPTINEKQIFTEPTLMARLQSGQLDAASAYKIQPGPFNLPYIQLPPTVNLSGEDIQSQHPDIKLTVGEKTWMPESLIYYAAALKTAPNPSGAVSLVSWLRGAEAQAIFRQYQYDAPGSAQPLHP
jgi:molybdate/tungstate transport system substrate-binding protein